MTMLGVRGLGIDSGGNTAVDAVDFDVEPGAVSAIIGPNGAGKTTLFNMLSGHYRPSRGSVHFADQDLTAASPERIARAGVGRTFQNLQIFAEMSALENVMAGAHLQQRSGVLAGLFGLRSARRDQIDARRVATDLLAFVGLTDVADHDATALSYGQQKKLEIARALACAPKLLLLDEPAAGCNAVETAEIDELIEQILSNGTTVLLVEHDMQLVMKISTHVVVLDQGRKIADGLPEEVAKDPAVIEAYLGVSETEELGHA